MTTIGWIFLAAAYLIAPWIIALHSIIKNYKRLKWGVQRHFAPHLVEQETLAWCRELADACNNHIYGFEAFWSVVYGNLLWPTFIFGNVRKIEMEAERILYKKERMFNTLHQNWEEP